MEQDWIYGLLGGVMIGLGGAVYLLANGRIMGASGILGGLVDGSGRDTWKERAAFLFGVFVLPILVFPFFNGVETHVSQNWLVIIAAGLLVGVGTRFANGCTSGHGGLFGTGLFISGMTDTSKVQGWLDIFGNWDPTLAFVMGGAIVPMFFAWRLTNGRKPIVGGAFPTPPEPKIGRNRVLGSVLFGFGWGLAGLCPGPAIASLSYGGIMHWVFVVAMLAGMYMAPNLRGRMDRVLDRTVAAE